MFSIHTFHNVTKTYLTKIKGHERDQQDERRHQQETVTYICWSFVRSFKNRALKSCLKVPSAKMNLLGFQHFKSYQSHYDSSSDLNLLFVWFAPKYLNKYASYNQLIFAIENSFVNIKWTEYDLLKNQL